MFTATWLSPTIPGVKLYMDAMNQYAPDSLENNSALTGWATMTLFGGAMRQLGATEPTQENIAAAANTLQGFTGDGLLQPVTFPEMHSRWRRAWASVRCKSGAWKLTAGTADNPFLCGTPVAASWLRPPTSGTARGT